MTPIHHRTAGRAPSAVRTALAALGTTLLASGAPLLVPGVRPRLERTNFRGRTVDLLGGIGVAAGTVAAAFGAGRSAACGAGDVRGVGRLVAAGVVATGAAGAAGLVDDLDAGAHDGDAPAKGLAGHLEALARGRVTTGVLKIAVIGSGALVSSVMLTRHRGAVDRAGAVGLADIAGAAVGESRRGAADSSASAARVARAGLDAVTGAVVIASWANVHNLLDLRPGRALKAAALLAAPLSLTPGPRSRHTRVLAAGALGTVAAALPGDLGETTMLGDTGANAVGALVGTALAAHPRRSVRLVAAVVGTGLVLASERVSFSRVIADTPVLSALDALGRRSS